MFHCYRPWRYAYVYGNFQDCDEDYDKDRSFRRKNRRESRAHRHGGFGVRRPLRYLSYHLDLDESQRRKLAASLERLKLEREQARLDRKKADASLADALADPEVTGEAIVAALLPRAQIVTEMQTVIAEELQKIVAALDDDQREEFAHLLRTGILKV